MQYRPHRHDRDRTWARIVDENMVTWYWRRTINGHMYGASFGLLKIELEQSRVSAAYALRDWRRRIRLEQNHINVNNTHQSEKTRP